MDLAPSLFDRFLSRPRPLWVALFVSLIILVLPFVAAMLDRKFSEFLISGIWRAYLMAPAIMLYIWLISPAMYRVGNEVVISIRPVVQLDDESFASMVEQASQVNPLHEMIAFGIGAVFGVVSTFTSGFTENVFWLGGYALITNALMYGLLTWVIYASVANTRLNAALHRQSMKIDILDPAPFEAVGRQSLLLALVFIGGITLSLLFSLQVQTITSWVFWLGYFILVLVVMLIFFLNMRPTHQLLAQAKKDELDSLQKRINNSCRALLKQLDQGQHSDSLSGEINARVAWIKRAPGLTIPPRCARSSSPCSFHSDRSLSSCWKDSCFLDLSSAMDKGKMPDSVIVYSRRVCEAEQLCYEGSLVRLPNIMLVFFQ
jgi:hypothetical protein